MSKGFQVVFIKNYSPMYKYSVDLVSHSKGGYSTAFTKYLGNNLKEAKKEVRYYCKLYEADFKIVKKKKRK